MPLAAWIALGGLFLTVSAYGATFAFFLGRQSERIATLEREAKREAGLAETVARLDERMKSQGEKLEHLDRTMQGMSRQLANLATGKGGIFHQAE